MENISMSDSDSNDDDYVPVVKKDSGDSDSTDYNSSNEDIEKQNSVDKSKHIKRRKSNNTAKTETKEKKLKTNDSLSDLTEDEIKKKSDLLWDEFMKDMDSDNKQSSKQDEKKIEEIKVINKTPKVHSLQNSVKEKPDSVDNIFEFAGEKITLTTDSNCSNEMTSTPKDKIARPTTGVAKILNVLSGKKGRLSTLEKSKLDWETFKSKEGIVEEIEGHNKGKNGFLERRDFLERTDLRRFEIEKEVRNKNRKSSI